MYGALAIIGSIVFDTFDGKVARLTKTSSKFGMELDSLADGVSFGFAPAILIYGFALQRAGIFGLIASFIFASGALLRLARFNIEAPEEGVQTYFKGIPAPGGASCIAALVIAAIHTNFQLNTAFELNTLAFIVIAVGLLMVSTVKYKTLKGKKTKGDYVYMILGIGMFIALCFIKHPAVAFFFLVCYFVLFGMLNTIYLNLKHNPKRRRRGMKGKDDAEDSEEANKDDQASEEKADSSKDSEDKKDESTSEEKADDKAKAEADNSTADEEKVEAKSEESETKSEADKKDE